MVKDDIIQALKDGSVDLSKWSIRFRYGRGDVLFLFLHVPGGDDVVFGSIGPDQPEDQAYAEAYLRHCQGRPVGRIDTARWNKRLAKKGLRVFRADRKRR